MTTIKDKIIRKAIRFILRHKQLYKIFIKYEWFNNLVYKQAKKMLEIL